MTSADPKTPSTAGEGGGMLPAMLAGAGILLVAGLFIFGGDDETGPGEAKDPKTVAANSGTAKGANGVGARPVDGASQSANRPRLNPRIANAVVTEGMAPAPTKKPEPTSFGSASDEIVYWEAELEAAETMLEMRQRSADYAPAAEAKIRENGTPDELAQIQKRLVVVADNLEKAKARVAEVEAKLEALKGK